jgi:hypothetical protein
MREDLLGRVGRDIAQATGLSGPEFGPLSRLGTIGEGETRGLSSAESAVAAHKGTVRYHRSDEQSSW